MTAAVAAAAASGDDAVSTCLICLEPDDADGSAQQRLLHGRRLRLPLRTAAPATQASPFRSRQTAVLPTLCT